MGRGAELDRINAILATVAKDLCPALVTIVGEPGLGKSRLANEFAAGVRDQAMVLSGQCEPGLEATYSPLHQVMAQVPVGSQNHTGGPHRSAT